MKDKSLGIVCTSAGFGGLEMNNLKLAKWLKDNYGWHIRLLLNECSGTFAHAQEYADDITTIQQLGGRKKATAKLLEKWLQNDSVNILLTSFNRDVAGLSWYKRWKNESVKLVYLQQMKVGVNKRDIIHTFRYKMLDKWISPLQYLKEEVLMRTKVPASKIEVIPLCMETDAFTSLTLSKNEAREKLQLPQDVFLLGVIGRIDPQKCQDFLIKGLAALRNKYREKIHLLIMGAPTAFEGDGYLQYLHQLVREYKLEDQVHFRGFSLDVKPVYKALDAFAMSSYGEPFGMVTIEAMLSGCPVIGVGAAGTKEILLEGKLGYLYNINDMDGFCNQLMQLMQRDNQQLIADARNEVLNEYAANQVVRKIDTLLYELAGGQ